MQQSVRRADAVRRVLDRPRALAGGAVGNARHALVAVTQQVLDRQVLAPYGADAVLAPGELAALTREQCLDRLRSKHLGRMAYVAREGVPDIAPVNYVVVGSDVLLRSGPGPKLQAAERRALVAFEVDDVDEQTCAGWSVVLVGHAQRLTAAQLRSIPEADLPRPWADGPRHSVVRIRPTRITGRRLA